MTSESLPWYSADLTVLDLEGSGAGDPEGESILEIAFVPLVEGRVDLSRSFSTLVNPGRRIVRRPWISPGLTNTNLARAPLAQEIEPEIERYVSDKILVGHNIKVDWRLLRTTYPAIRPRALVDTLKLARFLHPRRRSRGESHSLTAWIDSLELRDQVTEVAAGSQPHRALWDTVAAGMLLGTLLDAHDKNLGLSWLLEVAGVEPPGAPLVKQSPPTAPVPPAGLWD